MPVLLDRRGHIQGQGDDLKAQIATIDESLDSLKDVDEACAETALQLFDWSQQAADLWRGSNNAVRREILDAVCLNRTLSDVSLVTEKRKPFDVLAKRPDLKKSRGDKTRLELFCSALSDLQTSDPVAFAGLKALIGQNRKQLK